MELAEASSVVGVPGLLLTLTILSPLFGPLLRGQKRHQSTGLLLDNAISVS